MLVNKFGIDESRIEIVHGQVDKSSTNRILTAFKNKKLSILIGTSGIVGEGLNFFCDVAINLAGGDSDIQTVQKFGRVLRKDRTESGDVDVNTFSKIEYYEIFDQNHKWFAAHTRSRKRMYAKMGFEINPALEYMT